MEDVVNCKAGMIEALLLRLQNKMAEYRAEQARRRLARQEMGNSGSTSSPRSQSRYANEPAYPDSRHKNGHSLDHAIGHSGGGGGAAGGDYQWSGGDSGAHYEGGPYRRGGGGVPGPESFASSDIPQHVKQQLQEKDERIQELEETKGFLEIKISKLQQLLDLKDSRIQTLTSKLHTIEREKMDSAR